ncbi:MAG: site-2 protease family protein, partial [Thermoprotei archaeon]
PIGQLDGGHIFRGLFKDYQKYFGYATLFIMFLASIYYPPWLIFLLLIVFLGGVVHPPPLNDVIPLDKKTLVIGIISVLIFILCFIPVPFLVVH